MSIWGNSFKGLNSLQIQTRHLWDIWQEKGELDYPEDMHFYKDYPHIAEDFSSRFIEMDDDYPATTEFLQFKNFLCRYMSKFFKRVCAAENEYEAKKEAEAREEEEKKEKEAEESERRWRRTKELVSTPDELFFWYPREEVPTYGRLNYSDALLYFLLKYHGKKIIERNYNHVEPVRVCTIDYTFISVRPSALQKSMVEDFCRNNLVEYDDVLSLAVRVFLEAKPEEKKERYSFITMQE